MSKIFVKKGELILVNGGYLATKEEKPVINQEFVKAQESAHRIITTVKLAEGRDFKGKQADSLIQLSKDVELELTKNRPQYIEIKEVKRGELHEKLVADSLKFMEGLEQNAIAEKVNTFMQDFNSIKEYEDFAIIVEEGVVKLPKIYNIVEITEAVAKYIKLFN